MIYSINLLNQPLEHLYIRNHNKLTINDMS